MFDEVFLAGLGADAALAAARLMAVDIDGGALDVAGVADGDSHLFVFDQVFELDFVHARPRFGCGARRHIALMISRSSATMTAFSFLSLAENFAQFADAIADRISIR